MMVFTFSSFLLSLITQLIFLPLGAVFLMFSGKIFKAEGANFKNSFKISAIVVAISFVFQQVIVFVSSGVIVLLLWTVVYMSLIVFSAYLIKKDFVTSWGVAIGIWLMSFVSWMIVMMIVVAIVTIIWAFVAPNF